MARARPRLLLAVSPRVLSDALRDVLGHLEDLDVLQVPAGAHASGQFDLALVSGPTSVAARVVVELLDSGGCVVLHDEEGDEVIELRDASALVEVVAEHLGIVAPSLER